MSGAIGWPCQGGPLDGQMLAHHGTSYRVFKQPPPPSVTYTPGRVPPKTLECALAEYRLQQVGPERMAWVFQGWPA